MNGVLGTPPEIVANDVVTYRLRIDFDYTSWDSLTIADYLPLPVFDVATLDTNVGNWDTTADAASPPAGSFKFGPDDTVFDLTQGLGFTSVPSSIVPTASGNFFTLNFNAFRDPAYGPSVMDILFSVQVSTRVFADNLLLTNLAQFTIGNSDGTPTSLSGINMIALRQPLISVKKGVTGTSNPNSSINPLPAEPSELNDANLAATPIDSDVSDVQAGDILDFDISLQNTGGAGAFDMIISDIMPPGFAIPSVGDIRSLNLEVVRGDGLVLHAAGNLISDGGSQLAALGPGDILEIFGGGLELLDLSPPGHPICQKPTPVDDGSNIIVARYQLRVENPAAVPGEIASNFGGLTQYANADGAGATDNFIDNSNPPDNGNRDVAAATIKSPEIVTVATGDDIACTVLPDTGIGEFTDWQTTITIPQGRSPNASLRLNLATISNGMDFVPSSFTVIGHADIATTFSGGYVGVAAAANAAVSAFGVSEYVMDFGDLINNNASPVVDETIIVTFRTRVTNDGANFAGVQEVVLSDWNWDNYDSAQQTISDIDHLNVVEPILDIAVIPNPISDVDAADVVSYTVTVDHNNLSRACAFRVVVSDCPFDPNMYMATSVSASVTLGTPPVASDVAGPCGLGWNVQLDELLLGETLSIVFDVTVQSSVEFGVTETIDVEIASFASKSTITDPNERVFPNVMATADYSTPNPSAVASAQQVDATITLSDGGDGNVDLVVCEELTFRVNIVVPEGTTDNLLFMFNVDPQVIVLAAVVTNPNGGEIAFSPAAPVLTDSGVGFNDGVTIDFGQTVNTGDASPGDDPDNAIEVAVTVRVRNDPVTTAGLSPNATSIVTWSRAGAGGSYVDTDVVTVDIVEPALSPVVTATPMVTGSNGLVTWRIEVTHAGSGTDANAYQVTLGDLIPNDSTYVIGTATALTGAGFVPPSSGPTVTATDISFTWAQVDVGQRFGFVYDTQTNEGVAPGAPITDGVSLESFTGPPSCTDPRQLQDTSVSTTATVDVAVATLTLISSSDAETAGSAFTIGEVVVYELTVEFPAATTPPFFTTIHLPTAGSTLELLNAQVTFIGDDLTAANGGSIGNPTFTVGAGPSSTNDNNLDTFVDELNWALGEVVITSPTQNGVDNSIRIQVQAFVNSFNVAPVADTVNSTLFINGANVGGDFESFSIVEPDLVITNTRTTPPSAAVGDFPVFDIVLDHSAISSSQAFNIEVTVAFPTGLDFDGLSSDTCGAIVDFSSFPLVTFSGFHISLVEDCTLSVRTQVLNTAELCSLMTLPVSATYTSQERVTPQTRSYSVGPASDSVALPSATLQVVLSDLATSLPATTLALGDPVLVDLAIGETIEIPGALTLPPGMVSNCYLTLSLPTITGGELSVVSASLDPFPSDVSYTGSGTAQLVDSNFDSLADRVTVNFETLTNMGTSDRTIVIRMVALVEDRSLNVNGVTKTVSGAFSSTSCTLSSSDDADIVEPLLSLSTSLTNGASCDEVDLTITLENAPSRGPAYGVRLETLVKQADFVTTSTIPTSAPSGFTFSLQSQGSGQLVVFEAEAPPNGSVLGGETNVFIVTLTSVYGQQPLTLTTTNVAAYSVPPPFAGGRVYPDISNTTSHDRPEVVVTVTDGISSAQPGDAVTYTVVIQNLGAADASNVVLNIPSDSAVSFTPASATHTAGVSPTTLNEAGSPTTVFATYATLGAGLSSQLQFQVSVPDPVIPFGTTEFVTQATVSSDEYCVTILSDDPDTVPLVDLTRTPIINQRPITGKSRRGTSFESKAVSNYLFSLKISMDLDLWVLM